MGNPAKIGIVIAALVIGALAGYLYWPRWQPPTEEGETRVRQRAETYYRAQRGADFRGLAQHFTPARQVAEEKELKAQIAKSEQDRSRFVEATLKELEKGAESIKGADIIVLLEDNWAVTSGTSKLYVGESTINFPLDEVVWVFSGGEWWAFSNTSTELNAYGNPPDATRKVLERQRLMNRAPGSSFMQQKQAAPAGETGGGAITVDPPADNSAGDGAEPGN